MRVIAVDPGYRESAWLTFDGQRVIAFGIDANEMLMMRFWQDHWSQQGFGDGKADGQKLAVVFEQIESFGMPVGREVFETVFWTGRMFQSAGRITTRTERLPRATVKLHLCQSRRATDGSIRQALLDRFGGSGAVGTKRAQGPLYGVKYHLWAALALGVTWHDLRGNQPEEIRPGVTPQFTEDDTIHRPSLADA